MSFDNEIVEINRKGARKTIANSPFNTDVSHLLLHNGQIVACSSSSCAVAKSQSKPATLPATIVGAVSLDNSIFLGCADGTLHSFDGSTVTSLASLPGAITSVNVINRTTTQSYLAVGCADSVLRLYNSSGKKVSEVNLNSAATAVASYDFDKDGFGEMLVALEDNTICLVNLALLELPRLISSLHIGFNVSNLAIGVLYSGDMVSAVVTSQTGQVGLVFVEPKSDRSVLSGKAPKVTEAEIDELKKRVDSLEKQASEAKKKTNAAPSETSVEIKEDPTSQKFVFLVESERPISRIALSSPMPLRLKTRRDCQCVISMSPPKPDKNGVVVRPLEPGATRIAFDFSYDGGKVGDLRCFISFAKNAAVLEKSFTLKPFGFLRKIDDDPFLKDASPDDVSVLEITSAQTETLLSAVNQCLPAPLKEGESETFSSGPIGAVVSVLMKGDTFIAKSLFFPIIARMRSYVSERMDASQAHATVYMKLGDNCVNSFFAKVQDNLIDVMKAGAQYNKLKALQEVKNSSPMAQFGGEETTRILQDAPQIEKKFEECQDAYDAFLDEVRSFYLEMWQKSQDEAMNKVPEIIAAVKDVTDADSVQGLIKLMKATP